MLWMLMAIVLSATLPLGHCLVARMAESTTGRSDWKLLGLPGADRPSRRSPSVRRGRSGPPTRSTDLPIRLTVRRSRQIIWPTLISIRVSTNNLNVINDPNLGETYSVQSGVGPSGDLRTAIQSTSGVMEFTILNNYLGQPCNEDLTMQLCMEVYDDPALAGSQFAPYQYATDSQGDLTTYLGNYYTLTGSGQWLKVAFYFGPANLQGVNTAPLTGGPTVLFVGALPYIDRVELGVIRTGPNALAGQIP